MKKIIYLLLIISYLNSNAQQLELGLNLGYNFSNIADSNSNEERGVIGNALWNTNYDFNVVYYFKNPEFETSSRLNVIYKFSKKGSVSEINASNKYEFTSKTFGLTVGLCGNVGDKYILYFYIG